MEEERNKKLAISGASGLVGQALTAAAEDQGWEVIPMVREREAEGIFWSVDDQAINVEALEDVDAVVIDADGDETSVWHLLSEKAQGSICAALLETEA